MTAIAWVGLAAAVMLAPARAERGSAAARHRGVARASPSFRPSGLPLAVSTASVGLACVFVGGVHTGLVAAAVVCPVALLGLRRLAAHRPRLPPDATLPLTLDLIAAALRVGRPLPNALLAASLAASEVTSHHLRQVAGLLRLGASPAQAWAVVPPQSGLATVIAPAVRSATSGIRLAAAFERLAAELRASRAAEAAMRAHRAGVLAMAPLAACFLPAFVCLGIVPVVVGVAKTALGGLP